MTTTSSHETAAGTGLEEIPIIDVGPFLSGRVGALQELADRLGDACERIGFYVLVNHGVKQSLIDQTFAEAKRFHDLRLDDKLAVRRGDHYVGYIPMGAARINTGDGFDNAANKPDQHAAFHVNRDFEPSHPDVIAKRRYYVPQPWPANLPGFKENVLAYHAALEGLGRRLLPAYAVALGAPPDYFDAAFESALDWVRLIYYPPVEVQQDNQYGVGAHTDGGFLTLLPQTEVAGLQVMTQSGRWIAAPVVPGGILVNAGQTLKRWSNNRFLATPHRVISPRSGQARYSIPMFFNPSAHALIQPPPSCLGADSAAAKPAMRYGEFLDWYIANAYPKKLGDVAGQKL